MKILTLNTWQEKGPWQDRWKLIVQGIHKMKPDIIGFQEVFNEAWAKEIQKLTHYSSLVFPKEPGGEMFLSQYPVLETDCLVMKTQSPTEDYLRYALYARFKTPAGPLALFNTHLSWKIPESEIRQAQVQELLEFMDRKRKEDSAFVMGDFNASPNLPEIHQMGWHGWTDLYEEKHPLNPGITWNNRNPFTAGSSIKMPNRRIDYIWMKDPHEKFEIESIDLVFDEPEGGIYASDHMGVLAELKEKKK